MKTNSTFSILTRTIIHRFGRYNYEKHFLENYSLNFFSREEENALLKKFVTNGYFLDNPIFDPYRKQTEFQKFFGAFYCSTLPLVIKLHLLEDILKSADQEGISTFPPWTRLFRSFYNRKLITRRNIEMSGYLHLSEFLKTNSQHHV